MRVQPARQGTEVVTEPVVSALPGGPRSERTREAILQAARAHFAAHGYERATIRAIAAEAGIDPSMVMRYYGSKAGLFAAASAIRLQLPDLRGVDRERLAEVIVRHFVDRWEGDLADDALIFLFRSAVTNEAAAARLRQTFVDQVAAPVMAALDDPQAPRRAALVGTQMLGVALCRYILRLDPVASQSVATLVGDLVPTVQRYLTGELTPLDEGEYGGGPGDRAVDGPGGVHRRG
jgi:AcrR family transcriptional regulator